MGNWRRERARAVSAQSSQLLHTRSLPLVHFTSQWASHTVIHKQRETTHSFQFKEKEHSKCRSLCDYHWRSVKQKDDDDHPVRFINAYSMRRGQSSSVPYHPSIHPSLLYQSLAPKALCSQGCRGSGVRPSCLDNERKKKNVLMFHPFKTLNQCAWAQRIPEKTSVSPDASFKTKDFPEVVFCEG